MKREVEDGVEKESFVGDEEIKVKKVWFWDDDL